MRHAIFTLLESAAFIGGLFTLSVAGVRLKIDRATEEFFIQVDPVFDRDALRVISEFAESLGYEAMPEWECPPQELKGGAIRHWLAQKEVVHDSRSALQAV